MTEPTEPAASVDPADSAASAEPAAPVGSGGPAEGARPARASRSDGSAGCSGSARPVGSDETAAPAESAGSATASPESARSSGSTGAAGTGSGGTSAPEESAGPAGSAGAAGPAAPEAVAPASAGSAGPGAAETAGSGAAGGRRPRKRVRNYGAGRDALLDAAVRVVARGGLRRLTYRAVAEEAGVTHGLVVHHFGSRDALIEEALAHAVRSSLNSSALEPGTGRIADFSVSLADMVESGPDLQAFQYELMLEARRRSELMPHLRCLYEEYFDAARRELSQMLGRPVDRGLYRLVFAALEGLVLHQLVFGEREVTEEALARLRTMLQQLAEEPDGA